MDAAPLSTAWMPGTQLTLGVTGHRLERLGLENAIGLRAAIDAILDQIATQTKVPCTFRMVSALAEGADSIAAHAAFARQWIVDAVLPFPRADYRADFPDDGARTEHDEQVEAARAVFELPGRRENGESAIAYERAGRIVLGQCDILLAIWDSGPVRGRGGAAQIVAEAVIQGIPVIHIDPAGAHAPILLWDGLTEHDLGQQSIDTVPRGDLTALSGLITALVAAPSTPDDLAMLRRFDRDPRGRLNLALAYPLLLAIMGIRRLRWSDVRAPVVTATPDSILVPCSGVAARSGGFGTRLQTLLAARFARADAAATRVAQAFRSGYVTNFALAALAVLLALSGLALPSGAKPVLITLELVTIGAILILTQAGNRVAWHRRWLDSRQLAERLRCLSMAAQVGELDLRAGGANAAHWVDWYARATARELGLPDARVDAAYLDCVKAGLGELVDGQIAYLRTDAHRMHMLEHRLHRVGTALFMLTALVCVGFLAFEAVVGMGMGDSVYHLSKPLAIGGTILSAALPTIGAAIYGIRMQGDFAGVAERAETLATQLETLRHVMVHDELAFDTLRMRIRRVADLMTAELASWRHAYHARPLTLPG